MKSINKLFIALGVSALALTSCVDDLDNPVIDPNDIVPETFAQDPKGYMDRVLAECYQGLATSGYGGPGNSIISGGDAGANSFTRAVFVCNELTTDEFA